MSTITLLTLTFNCGRKAIHIPTLTSQLIKAISPSNPPSLIFLSLQEIAPIHASFIGSNFLTPYYTPIQTSISDATRHVTGHAYSPIAIRNVGMTALMLFARDASCISGIATGGVGVGKMEMGNKGAVGVRIMYCDAKVETRDPEEGVEIAFVAAHLAASEEAVQRRNEDWRNIVRRLVFTAEEREEGKDGDVNHDETIGASITSSTTTTQTPLNTNYSEEVEEGDEQPLLATNPINTSLLYKPTSHLFVAGDLNYRTSHTKPSPEDVQTTFPQPHYPRTSPLHYLNLLDKDQLNRERAAGRTLHGMEEMEIKFRPTYKYTEPSSASSQEEGSNKLIDGNDTFDENDIREEEEEEGKEWNWASHRWPSWCDRILYLPSPPWLGTSSSSSTSATTQSKVTPQIYTALPQHPTSDHLPVIATFGIPLSTIPLPSASETSPTITQDPRISPPFNIDPEWEVRRQRARRAELVVGWVAYLLTTVEGGAYTIAGVLGIVGLCVGLGAIF